MAFGLAQIPASLPRLFRQAAVRHVRHCSAQLGRQLGDHLRVQVPRGPGGCVRPVLQAPQSIPAVAGSPPARTQGCRTSHCHLHLPREFRQDRAGNQFRDVVQRMHRHFRQHHPRLVPAFSIVGLKGQYSDSY